MLSVCEEAHTLSRLQAKLRYSIAPAIMDQDFHYYGTYYAATAGGFNQSDATLIAKASNFIDFLNEDYPSPWNLTLTGGKTSYEVKPRYTYQGSIFQTFLSPQDSVWCVYHFTPGNYPDPPGTPSREEVHGVDLASQLPLFETRDTNGGKDILGNVIYYPLKSGKYLDQIKLGRMLNRPQSGLSRSMIMDTIRCACSEERLRSILCYAIGGKEILKDAANVRRFRLILLGVRAHVLADTWAHQDFCGLDNVLNTYWDANYDGTLLSGWRNESIYYNDQASKRANIVLSSTYHRSNPNLDATPNGTSYVGHGWMGHLPDFSFVTFEYKPCWADPTKGLITRDNRVQYKAAWMELVSLFTQANGQGQLKLDNGFKEKLSQAVAAIGKPCRLDGNVLGRKSSADAWQDNFFPNKPSAIIDVVQEPDPNAVLGGRTGTTSEVQINSDLYLFQIAADYHFHFVKTYLSFHGIYELRDEWSQRPSALNEKDGSNLFIESGSISAVYATQRKHSEIFFIGEDGFLNYYYFPDTTWRLDRDSFKLKKVACAISAVFNPRLNHSEVFFVGTDAKLHRYYAGGGQGWTHEGEEVFKERVTGSVAAVYAEQREHSEVFSVNAAGHLCYYYYYNNAWALDNTSFIAQTVVGPVSAVFNLRLKHSEVFFVGTDAKLHRYYAGGGQGWTHEGEEVFKERVTGSVSAVYAEQREHSEVFFVGKAGYLCYYYYYNNAWTLDNTSFISQTVVGPVRAVFNKELNHSEVFFVGADLKLHHYYAGNGKGWAHEAFDIQNFKTFGSLSAVYIPQQSQSEVFFKGENGCSYQVQGFMSARPPSIVSIGTS